MEGADLLVCIGNTGCGKSTLLSSLIHGVESMKTSKIDMKTGKKSMKKLINCSEPSNIFKIGHSELNLRHFYQGFRKTMPQKLRLQMWQV